MASSVKFPVPTAAELEEELARERRVRRSRRIVAGSLGTLAVVAALAVLMATLLTPVLRIYGTSMSPTLEEGNLVVTLKTDNLERGDVIAFYYNNKVLVKRVIAGPGDWVDIADDGTVSVNGEVLDEPYVKDKGLGSCNITLPYQVPDSRVFVMGDHRSTSVDSRSASVGCVAQDQVVGKLVLRLWPAEAFGRI